MKMYQVDAFTNQLFSGNPAAVIITKQWLDVEIMQNIAIENNLSETSFARKIDEQVYEIRWFSPIKEVQFCGYGTLATSFIIFQENPQIKSITFQVKQMGEFYIQKQENGFIAMNFPVQIPEKIHNIPPELKEALQHKVEEVYINPQAYIVVYESAEAILQEQPDFEKIKQLGGRRVAITAKNDLLHPEYKNIDIVSRYFTPSMGIDEDPVTGSLHTSLIPLWKDEINKNDIIAYQASNRGGILHCRMLENNRIEISGQCRLYMEAKLFL